MNTRRQPTNEWEIFIQETLIHCSVNYISCLEQIQVPLGQQFFTMLTYLNTFMAAKYLLMSVEMATFYSREKSPDESQSSFLTGQ
jgi:hypothetical protein